MSEVPARIELWPGPVPYAETDEERFFGRSTETDQLLTLIESQRLTVLSARSGAGKTSMLRASLLPKLRRARVDNRNRYGFPLLVRGWSHLGQRSPGAALLEAVQVAFRDTEPLPLVQSDPRSLVELRLMRSVPVPPLSLGSVLPYEECRLVAEYLAELAEVVGGLVLIVDQAEELLGSGIGQLDVAREDETLAILGILAADFSSVHVVVSLRGEFRDRLDPLMRHVDSIAKRTYRLEPLLRGRVEDLIQSAVTTAGGAVRFEQEQTRQVLDWLSSAEGDLARERDRPIDLLRLQALLVDLVDYARTQRRGAASDEPGAVIQLDEATLENYLAGQKPSVVARAALERHLWKILDRLPVPPDAPHAAALARRLVARIGPWLSSPGGFKRPTEESELIHNVLQPELEVLLISSAGAAGAETSAADQVRSVLRDWRHDASSGATLAALPFLPEADAAVPWRNGAAHDWTPQRALGELLEASFAALDHLDKSSVLKRSKMVTARGDNVTMCELVHDGFGPALVELGQKERRTLRDALASVVSHRGVEFKWDDTRAASTEKPARIEHASWLGCNLRDITFEGTTFSGCTLRGTIFVNCRFIACRFDDCDLDGTVFTGSPSEIKDTTFLRVKARSALFRDVLFGGGGNRFEDCVLEGTTFANNRLEAPLELDRVGLSFAQIYPFVPQGAATLTFVSCDLRHALLGDGGEAFVKLDASNATDGIVRELLPWSPDSAQTVIPAG